MGLYQNKMVLHSKKSKINKMKRQLTDTSGNRLMSKIYKELIKLNTKRQIIQLKNGQRTQINTFSKRTDDQQTYEKMLNVTNHHEVQIKTIMRYHPTPVKMAIFNKSANNKCWGRCGENGTLVHCCWECRLVQPLWKTV